jgi:hypothetical protein
MPFFTEAVWMEAVWMEAVCVSIDVVFTSVKTAKVAVISPTAHLPADWIYSMTAEAILPMNKGVELARVSAVLEAIESIVVEANAMVVEDRASTLVPRAVMAALTAAMEEDSSERD